MPRRRRSRTAPRAAKRARRPAWVGIAIMLAALLAVLSYLALFRFPVKAFYSGDCGTKLVQTQSFVMRHWLSPALVYPGETIDPGHQFVETGGLIVRKGRVYGSHSAAFAFLSSLPYAAFGYRGLHLIPALALAGAVFLLWLLVRATYGPRRALLAAALAAFCTPLLFYGVEFWEHTLAVFMALAALLLLAGPSAAARPARLAAAGAVLAAAYAVRPETAVLIGAIGLGLVVSIRPARALGRSLGSIALGCAAILIPLAIANEIWFGDPWGTLLGLHLREGHPDPRLMVVEKLFMPLTAATALRAAGAVLAGLLVWWLARREARGARGRLTQALGIAAAALVVALAAAEGWRFLALWRKPAEVTSLAESFPLFWALPLAAAGWSAQAAAAARATSRFLIVTAGVYLIAVLATSPTWGGAQWGPRVLLLVIPLLVVLLAARPWPLRLASGRVALLAVCLLGLVSAGVQVVGLRWLGEVKGLYVNTIALFTRETEPEAVLVSDQFWLQEVLAPIYYQRRFFYVSQPPAMGDFVTELRRAGVPRFYCLLPRTTASGATAQESSDDLLAQVTRYHLAYRGLTIERWAIINDRPFYLLRIGTGTGASP